MLKFGKALKKVTEKTAHRISELYAVFERETDKFLGVGDFTTAEIKALEDKYVFSKI